MRAHVSLIDENSARQRQSEPTQLVDRTRSMKGREAGIKPVEAESGKARDRDRNEGRDGDRQAEGERETDWLIKRDRVQSRSSWILERVSRLGAGWTACLMVQGDAYVVYLDADGQVFRCDVRAAAPLTSSTWRPSGGESRRRRGKGENPRWGPRVDLSGGKERRCRRYEKRRGWRAHRPTG